MKMTLDSVDDPERSLEEGLAIAKTLADSGLVDLIHFGRGAYSCRCRWVASCAAIAYGQAYVLPVMCVEMATCLSACSPHSPSSA